MKEEEEERWRKRRRRGGGATHHRHHRVLAGLPQLGLGVRGEGEEGGEGVLGLGQGPAGGGLHPQQHLGEGGGGGGFMLGRV